MFLINRTHKRGSGRKDFIYENENRLFRGEFDAFTDDVAELSDCQVGWDEIFLLIDGWDIGLFNFFADHLITRG